MISNRIKKKQFFHETLPLQTVQVYIIKLNIQTFDQFNNLFAPFNFIKKKFS